MSTAIYRVPAKERVAHVAGLLRELGTEPVAVTYEAVRGISGPSRIVGKVVGLSYDVAKYAYSLVVLDTENNVLCSVPLPVLVSVEAVTA